jgi:hypothetical protein
MRAVEGTPDNDTNESTRFAVAEARFMTVSLFAPPSCDPEEMNGNAIT